MSSNNKDTTSPPPKGNAGASSIPGSSSTPGSLITGSSMASSDEPKTTRKLPHPEIKIHSQKSNPLAPNIDEPKRFPLGFALEDDDDDDGIVDDGSKRNKNGADYLTYEQILKDEAEMEDLKKRLRMRSFLFQKKVEAQKLAAYFKTHNPSVLIPDWMIRPLRVDSLEDVDQSPEDKPEIAKQDNVDYGGFQVEKERCPKSSEQVKGSVQSEAMSQPPLRKQSTGNRRKDNLPKQDTAKGGPSGQDGK